jgi:hypothetical protein
MGWTGPDWTQCWEDLDGEASQARSIYLLPHEIE